jgi:two-component system response regulator YesN
LEEDFAELDDYDLSLMEYGIANIAEEIFGKRCLIWEGKDSYGYLVFVLKEKDCAEFAAEAERSMEQIEQAAVSLHHNVRLYLKRSISVCLVKKRGVFPSGIGALHRAGVRAICREISGESDFFLSVEGEQDQEQEQTRGIRGCLQELYQPPLMSQLLDMGQWDKAEQKLVDIFTELEIKWIESAEYIQECYCALAGSFYYFAHRNGYRLEEPLYAEAASSPDILMAPSMRQLRQWAVATCRRLREEAENSTRKSRSHIVALVHRFISSNLAGELTLQTISDHIKLHPAYLSKMYKAETGIGLSDYLLRCRMEEAARLLRSTNGKIYEIASETGYLTPHYFIKLFKSYYGVTPQEYREKLPD